MLTIRCCSGGADAKADARAVIGMEPMSYVVVVLISSATTRDA
jgi:hypothetical protein